MGAGNLVFAVFFLVNAIFNFGDCKFDRNKGMKEEVRKKYRRHVGFAFLGLMLIAIGTFIAEFVYRIRMDSRQMVLLFVIYMIPVLYIVLVKKHFGVK